MGMRVRSVWATWQDLAQNKNSKMKDPKGFRKFVPDNKH